MLNLLVTIRNEDKKLHDNILSGVWLAYRFEELENQRKMIIPINEISETLFFNQRLIISQPIKEPLAWRITKVEDLNPKGVRRLTFAADKYNQHSDYIEKDEEGNVIGMWADYFQSSVVPDDGVPSDSTTTLFSSITSRITAPGNPQIKVGSYKTFTLTFYEDDSPVDHEVGEWSFTIDGIDASDLLTLSYPAPNKVKVKFNGGDEYIGKILHVINTSEEIVSAFDVEIIAL